MSAVRKLVVISSMIFAAMIATPCSEASSTYAKYAILDYTGSNSTVIDWIGTHFSLKIAGNRPDPSVMWMNYYDIYGPSGIPEWLILKDWAAARGLRPEEILLHSKIDYTSAASQAWQYMDRFDNFEGANGVLGSSDGGTFTDLTSAAYNQRTTWMRFMYFGYEEPFDQINVTFATAGSGIQRVWEYWNGMSWQPLNTSGAGSGLTASGQVAFYPPADWSRVIINKSRNKYFVRCRITAATTYPVSLSVKGDNWLNGGGNACRGWDSSSSSIINSGELQYNPTPPAGKTARFPYQARITYWSANHFIADPADFQKVDGATIRTWSQFLAYRINQLIQQNGYTGVMGDDGQRSPSNEGLQVENTDFSPSTTWATENLAKFSDLVAEIHSINPGAKIGLNGQTKTYGAVGDWNLAEYHTSTWITGGLDGNGDIASNSGSSLTYDDYLPAKNPAGRFGLLIYADTVDTVPNKSAAWDRSNRGPIVALSKHLIGANASTFLAYYSRGGYVYSETDEVFLKDGSILHQATQPAPQVADVKRWGTWFPAMGVDVGVPDVNGWNGGGRSFTWRSGATIGGGLNVWRRDYTNAIVLHRPAMWNTTDLQYTTPSLPIDLGGVYYPLFADGTTGDAITSITLRHGEGAILMKSPITSRIPPFSSVPSPLNLRRVK